MARIVCYGEILLRMSAPGGGLLLQTPTLNVHAGGAEANVAVSLARFGHDARMVSTAPGNALSDAALGELRRWGVDTQFVQQGHGRMGLYFLTPGAGLRPSDIIYDRALSAFANAAATDWRAALEGAAWLHVSGVTPALNAACAEHALKAMRIAREAGVKVSFDANYRAKLWDIRGGDPRETLNAMFAEADLAFAEARDISLVTGEAPASNEESAEIAFRRYPNLQRIASTRRSIISADHHELGAGMFTRAGATHSASRTLTGIVDRIGGGDAFAAGLLHGIVTNAPDQRMLDFAVAAASLKHYIVGDFNLSTVADVDFLLTHSGSDVRR